MGETFLSVGIDIGTTTTQIVFSRLTIKQQQIQDSGKASISDRQIIYRSAIYYTPLSSPSKVNAEAIANIIKYEYKLAGFSPSDIHSGAVIITGEAARKENALALSSTLSLAAGKFVVATAGPELEAILSGQGAGAANLSEKTTDKVINFDIGGGTTNASVFFDGQAETPFALDIGGRLIKLSLNRTITYISPRLRPLINALDIPLYLGYQCKLTDLYKLCRQLAAILLDYSNGSKGGIYGNSLLITAAPPTQHYHKIMFSGGVAEYIYHPIQTISWESILKFQDIGIILGKCINELFLSSGLQIVQPKETIRATVIGAGIYSMSVSGNTVNIDEEILPLRDIPVIRLQENIFYLPNACELIAKKLAVYKESSVAIAFAGPKSPSYNELKAIATCLANADALIQLKTTPLVVVLEHDFAKALGQTLRPLLPSEKRIVCIDRIAVQESSYIDIGRSIGNVLPVVIKTLAFH